VTAQLALGIAPEAQLGTATFSGCGRYRYTLTRKLGMHPGRLEAVTGSPREGFAPVLRGGTALWVMLNPSTATADENDPTIRRVIGFARRDGFERLVVCNLFALRSTDPRALLAAEDRSGPGNLGTLREQARAADRVVVAWGAWGDRWPEAVAAAVAELRGDLPGVPSFVTARALWCVGTTSSGQPKHPLYVAGDTPLTPWRGP
jgi:hypothetical protein